MKLDEFESELALKGDCDYAQQHYEYRQGLSDALELFRKHRRKIRRTTMPEKTHQVRVYLVHNAERFHTYNTSEESANEAAARAMREGYRHTHPDGRVSWYPPDKIYRIDIIPLPPKEA